MSEDYVIPNWKDLPAVRLTPQGARWLNGCTHCGGYLFIMDDGLGTTSCQQCGCLRQMRSVLIAKGPQCQVVEDVYEDETVSLSDEELNDLR